MPVEWGVAERPFPGESVSGDCYVVEPFADGALVAVIDALGHGADAAETARRAATALRARPGEPLQRLFEDCHLRLRGGRGAVMSAAIFDDRSATLTWAGVGNVAGYLLAPESRRLCRREGLVPRNGVVGFQLPSIRPATISLTPDDTLVFATDGIATSFLDQPVDSGPPSEVANDLLIRHGKTSDDALVLVVSYRRTVSS